MHDNITYILSTKPLDESLVQKAADKNIVIDEISFVRIEKKISAETQQQINDLAQQVVTVIFTSVNAVEMLVSALPDKANFPGWKIYCLGGATFTVVKKYWSYVSILSTAKNAAVLSKQVIADNCKEVYFFCGNKRRDELPEILHQQGIQVHELIIYDTTETSIKVEKNYAAILFFSPSAVHSFFAKNNMQDSTIMFAIGETTAAAIKGFCNNKIVISNFPSKEQLVQDAIGHLQPQTYSGL